MGAIFSPPKPVGPQMPPPAANPAVLGSSQTQLAAQQTRKAGSVAEGRGFNNTIQTSPQGLQAPATARTTLLGD